MLRNCEQKLWSIFHVLQRHFREMPQPTSHRGHLATCEHTRCSAGCGWFCIQWSENGNAYSPRLPRAAVSRVRTTVELVQRSSTTPPMGFGSFRRSELRRSFCAVVYLATTIRSQGFSPSQRFDPAWAAWFCFTPHPPIGFRPPELFPLSQPWRLSTPDTLLSLASGVSIATCSGHALGSTRSTLHLLFHSAPKVLRRRASGGLSAVRCAPFSFP